MIRYRTPRLCLEVLDRSPHLARRPTPSSRRFPATPPPRCSGPRRPPGPLVHRVTLSDGRRAAQAFPGRNSGLAYLVTDGPPSRLSASGTSASLAKQEPAVAPPVASSSSHGVLRRWQDGASTANRGDHGHAGSGRSRTDTAPAGLLSRS